MEVIKICENCKNKDVCKWIDTVNSMYSYYDGQDKDLPINVTLICNKRRVTNA